MGLLEALVVGLVGGMADFLPVSASAHRVLVGRVLFGGAYDRGFAGVCELSSALAAAVALRGEIREVLRSAARPGTEGRRVGGLLLAAAVTAAFISLPFSGAYVGIVDDVSLVGVLLLVSGLLLYVAEELGRRTQPLESLGLPGALLIGLIQVLAVLPGISRPGTAISGGMLVGLTREAATRFALLLSIPLLVVAGIWNLSNGEGVAGGGAAAFGAGASFVGAFLAVGFLRWYVREFSLMMFAYYLWMLGVFAIGYGYMR